MDWEFFLLTALALAGVLVGLVGFLIVLRNPPPDRSDLIDPTWRQHRGE